MFYRNIFTFILILCFNAGLLAQQIQKVEVNPKYTKYLELKSKGLLKTKTRDGHSLGYIPPKYIFKTDVPEYLIRKSFPASYDLRQEGKMTSVKNQLNCGSCWAHASLASIESRLKILGYGDLDLSENNLKDCNKAGATPCDGGFASVTTAYVSRIGDGPVLEANDPYIDKNADCKSGLVPVAQVTGARYFSSDANVLKQALQDYGALYTALDWNDDAYSEDDFTFYSPTTNPSGGHAVTLCGWDDNKVTKGGTGAWICKNSWASTWGDSGYFYIAYQDKTINEEVACWPTITDYNPNITLYMYDVGGSTPQTGQGTDVFCAIKFTAKDDQRITKVATFVNSNTTVSFEIYNSFDGSANFSNLLGSLNNQSCLFAGYYTFDLLTSVSIKKGSDFYIKVKYSNPTNSNYPICQINNPDLGKGWVSFDGSSWQDAGSTALGASAYIGIRAWGEPNSVQTVQAPALTAPTDKQIEVALPFTLSWKSSTGATGYGVQLSSNSNNWSSLLVNENNLQTTTYNVPVKLEKNSTYYWRVNAIGSSGTSEWSNVWSFTTSGPISNNLFFDAGGKDLNGVTRTIRTYKHTDGFYYPVWDIDNLVKDNTTFPNEPKGGIVAYDAKSTNDRVFPIQSTDNTWESTMISAYYNTKVVYDYFKNKFNRNGIDGKGTRMNTVIHYGLNGSALDYSTWNGVSSLFSDGVTKFKPLPGALDIVARTIGYGINQYTANIQFTYPPSQSGSLVESFSDLWGIMIDSSNFTIGEDIMKNGSILRDFQNPDNPVLGADKQPVNISQFDPKAVFPQTNCGIPNRAAFLIIDKLGRDKTARIYYRALTSYLNQQSDFKQCRLALERAAKDLYGNDEVLAVQQSFDAVGITSGYQVTRAKRSIPAVVNGKSTIAYSMTTLGLGISGQIALYDVESKKTSTINDTAAYVYVNGSDRSQISAPLNGKKLYFANRRGKLSYLDLNTNKIKIFDTVCIYSPGDIMNATVSPDEKYVVLISIYDNDPNLYIYDFHEVTYIPLKSDISGIEGPVINNIRYADAVCWSPDTTDFRIALDAYNEIPIGLTDKLQYWALYEVAYDYDKNDWSTLSFYPAQPEGTDLGYVKYSNTNPDMIAFNVFWNDTVDTYVADFSQPDDIGYLNLPYYKYNNIFLTDALTPNFSPDDKSICVVSDNYKALILIDYKSYNVTDVIKMSSYVNKPYWFMKSVTTDVKIENSIPKTVSLITNYPNPFNPSTKIRFDLPEATDVELSVFNVLGQKVSVILEGNKPAGTHEIQFDAKNLSSGTYIIQLKAGNTIKTQKMMLMR